MFYKINRPIVKVCKTCIFFMLYEWRKSFSLMMMCTHARIIKAKLDFFGAIRERLIGCQNRGTKFLFLQVMPIKSIDEHVLRWI